MYPVSEAKSKNDKNISGLINQINETASSGKLGIHTFTNASACVNREDSTE